VGLQSQLDKYRAVAAITFPGNAIASATAIASSAHPPPTRKQRLHGISAEPQSLTTLHDAVAHGSDWSAIIQSDAIKTIFAEIANSRHFKSPA